MGPVEASGMSTFVYTVLIAFSIACSIVIAAGLWLAAMVLI